MSEHGQATMLSSVRRIDHLPAATTFAKYPASWYLFGASRDLKPGQTLSRKLFGRTLVGYRTTKGSPVIMDSRCSHLGADLTGGKVEADCIRCPFHGWAYGPDGRCVSIPNSNEIPGFARQMIFPVAERHGLIFVFFGAEALFPLPSFSAVSDDDLVAAPPARFIADTSWYMVAAHGYDEQHFETVHGRRLLTPLTVDRPATYARRSRYTAEIVGNRYYDRFLRSRLSRSVSISITTWGGTMVMISGDFGRVKSLFMIALEPLNDQQTLCSVIVFKQRSLTPVNRWLWDPLSLTVRKLLTRAYLIDEVRGLGCPRYAPHRLIAADREMKEYFRWVAALPQSRNLHDPHAVNPQPQTANAKVR